MKIKYHKQIVDMLYNEWDLGKRSSEAKGKTCAWIYWLEILNEAEKILIEKEDYKVIGVCGYSKQNSRKHIFRKNFYGILKNILINSPLIKNKKAIYKYNNDYDYLPKELENYFDGEITILIVDKLHRGKGIGKQLLTKIFEVACIDNMKNIQILSYESCNSKFYESLNCKKIYEKIIPCGEPDKCGNISSEKGFIYEKRFKQLDMDKFHIMH